jgi:hypothetical protein
VSSTKSGNRGFPPVSFIFLFAHPIFTVIFDGSQMVIREDILIFLKLTIFIIPTQVS